MPSLATLVLTLLASSALMISAQSIQSTNSSAVVDVGRIQSPCLTKCLSDSRARCPASASLDRACVCSSIFQRTISDCIIVGKCVSTDAGALEVNSLARIIGTTCATNPAQQAITPSAQNPPSLSSPSQHGISFEFFENNSTTSSGQMTSTNGTSTIQNTTNSTGSSAPIDGKPTPSVSPVSQSNGAKARLPNTASLALVSVILTAVVLVI